MNYRYSWLFLVAVLFSPTLNAADTITGNQTLDEKTVQNTMRTLDTRAKQCHRMINYLGGYAAAAELYRTLRDDAERGHVALGACVEFVKISTRLVYMIGDMERAYGERPTPPELADRINVVTFMLYLKTIEKEVDFMQTFER